MLFNAEQDENNSVGMVGVKGMRWGIRKDRGSGGTRPKKTATPKKKASSLSDDDLKKIVTRMEMERKYNQMIKEQRAASQTPIQKGVTVVTGILVTSGKSAVQSYANKAMSDALNKALAPRVS